MCAQTNTLPADPDGQNDDRASWAQSAMTEFSRVTGMAAAGEDAETICGDMLSDLMHWCDRNGCNFDALLARARGCYAEEIGAKG